MIKAAGFIIWGLIVFLILLKKLRDNRRILVALLFSLPFAIYALSEKITGNAFTEKLRPTDALFMPLVTVCTYALLRYLYKKAYKREPTYNRSSWFDPEEGRNQNIFDLIVFISPMVMGGLFPLLIK